MQSNRVKKRHLFQCR